MHRSRRIPSPSAVSKGILLSRRKTGYVLILASLLWMAGTLLPKLALAAPDASTAAAIEYLIESVSQSDMVFVRNFSRHDAQRAAKHIRDKYEHFVDEIDSPEKFIELCASESLMTGRDYRVILPGGEEHLARDWMQGLLAKYRAQSPIALNAQ